LVFVIVIYARRLLFSSYFYNTLNMSRTLNLGQHLFARLRQLGVQSVHGVPGDFTLPLLDYVKPAGLKWIGNCNELNAGYAADGYARVKGISALSTTYGVGELSALNAVAGSYAEYAPVVRTFCSAPCRRRGYFEEQFEYRDDLHA
jgi:TPP-dependent 2-oxoacid decarboxylase